MKQLLITLLALLCVGGGYLLGTDGDASRTDGRSDSVQIQTLEKKLGADQTELERLRAELARLREELRARQAAEDERAELAVPVVADSLEDIERLLADAFEENNVDWLIEVIERLLRMGQPGHAPLRRLLEDIIFKAKFLPSQSDFRLEQLYRVGRVFANLEPQFISFLNYLLLERRAHPWFKQGAMMAGAFYIGGNAKGSDELKQTMLQLFLADSGGTMPGIPPRMQRKMQVMAMAMTGDPQMIGPLRDELAKTEKDKDKADIINALAYLGDPKVVPDIQDRLNPQEGDFRKELQALGRVGTDDAHQTATGFLRAIPDSKRFYRHARDYVRSGGGSAGVLLIKERFESNPKDKDISQAIGTLRRYPTKESLDTLNSIAVQSPHEDVQKRASEAATEVTRRISGEIPNMPK